MFFFLLPAIANPNASKVVKGKDGEQEKQPRAHEDLGATVRADGPRPNGSLVLGPDM